MTPLIYWGAGSLVGFVVAGLVCAACARIFAQRLRHAIQLEFEYLSRRQLEHDEAEAQAQRQWRAEQEERHARDMRALLAALNARGGKAALPAAAARQPAFPGTAPAPARAPTEPPSAVVSARPPELVHAPLPRAGISAEAAQPEPELSDEEIDALPPELPSLAKPRKRLLRAPTKPPLRSV